MEFGKWNENAPGDTWKEQDVSGKQLIPTSTVFKFKKAESRICWAKASWRGQSPVNSPGWDSGLQIYDKAPFF